MANPDRFLGRADVYAAARPGYPASILEWLRTEAVLESVADLGAGTGLFTELLLRSAGQVTAIEPNAEMRQQLSRRLAEASDRLTVQDGTAEHTGLPAQSVHLVTAAQAAHWFDPTPTVQEFRRVLRPGGQVLLLWNDWRGSQEPFNQAYGKTVGQFYLDGDDPVHISRVPEAEIPLFMPGGYQKQEFDNPVFLNGERLHALAGSVSYLPGPQDARYPDLTAALDVIFEKHQQGGLVTLHYRTHCFLGRV